MKLLFVTPEYLPDSGGGIITFYRFLLPEMVRQGHEVEVVVADGRHIGQPERVIDGVKVRYLPPAVHGRWLQQFARYSVVFPWLQENLALAWAAWEIAAGGAGWDHVEVTEWPLLFVPWILHRDRARCTIQLHGSHGQITLGDGTGSPDFHDPWVRLIECALIREAMAVQTNSQLNARLWQERLQRPVSVENPGFLVPGTPAPGTGKLRRPLLGRVFGRLNVGKGAVALAESLAEDLRDVTIEWFGNDTSFGRSTVAAALGERFPAVMGRHFHHHPQVPHAEVLARLTDGAFVLIPTLCDVFNLTAAEAMAMRAVTVCSVHAGACELITDGVNGFLYDPLKPGDLARTLQRLAALTEAEVRAITDHAAATVQERLDPVRSVQRRVHFYETLTTAPTPPSLPAWLGEAVSGSDATCDPRALLDRCGFSDLTAAVFRRVR